MLDNNSLSAYETYKDPYQIEKDYLEDLMLYTLYDSTTTEFVFKGGTSLSKFYYSDRFSEDLDFTLSRAIGTPLEYVINILDKIINGLEYRANYKITPIINRFGTINATLAIEGPRYNGKQSTLQNVRFEINTKGSLLYAPVSLSRVPIYADAAKYIAPVMDKREILSEKIRAIMSKGRKNKERDLYDIHFLTAKKIEINTDAISKKFVESKIESSSKVLLENIESISKTWDELRPFVRHKLEDYEYVKREVEVALKNAGLL